jgi:hypothetical protein
MLRIGYTGYTGYGLELSTASFLIVRGMLHTIAQSQDLDRPPGYIRDEHE